MKASVILLCVFAAFVAATDSDPKAADSTTTAAPPLRTIAPKQPITFSDLTPQELSFYLQYWRENTVPPGPGTVMPGGWKWPDWPDKRDKAPQAESKFDPELAKLIQTTNALPKPQGKINHYVGEQAEDKGDSNEDEDDEDNEDEDDGGDNEDTSPASPLEKRKQKNPCKRGCRADIHCCPGDRCFYGVCLGPQKPPRDVKREIYEFYASADTESERDE
ncbi:hypothetical protein ANOM_002796 [Aspergillus nomiae NRRL 13137]|uniref:Uncharacterized protein n=1 Tax=Aspergillus nomiae NRRL (strain ATCC 15546 / NRRL 13137 / CBS 260.88 / M93) TaxID=1509407 RepID=A0A0L1JAM4_ASPN3|nr:uncharacterized protein ANOM_002796 [Aspergillus nomiae NRRL 13137]KNG88772.1 hypothetical protein ANOM_002796 [Aspergillus nomiae NRRL 13137]